MRFLISGFFFLESSYPRDPMLIALAPFHFFETQDAPPLVTSFPSHLPVDTSSKSVTSVNNHTSGVNNIGGQP
jgi:hypothetical protein